MLLTVEGIYKDDKVELEETPGDLKETRVLVTFLPKEILIEKTLREARIHALKGKYAFVPTGSEEFALRRQQEIDKER